MTKEYIKKKICRGPVLRTVVGITMLILVLVGGAGATQLFNISGTKYSGSGISLGGMVITAGQTWDMEEGWTLTAISIDARATPRQAWLSLKKDGAEVDSRVVEMGQTYNYNNVIFTKIDSIFAGSTSDLARLTDTFIMGKAAEPLSGWNIHLMDVKEKEMASTTTDGNGSYKFTGLSPGIYNVSEETRGDWMNVTSPSQIITIDTSDVTNIDFINTNIVPVPSAEPTPIPTSAVVTPTPILPIPTSAVVTPTPTPTPTSAVRPVRSISIDIKNFAFNPLTVTIPRGTTVTWTNNDTVPHTVTSVTGIFDSGIIGPGMTYSHTFDQGSFEYECTIHPSIPHGTIVVTIETPTSSATPIPIPTSATGQPVVIMPTNGPNVDSVSKTLLPPAGSDAASSIGLGVQYSSFVAGNPYNQYIIDSNGAIVPGTNSSGGLSTGNDFVPIHWTPSSADIGNKFTVHAEGRTTDGQRLTIDTETAPAQPVPVEAGVLGGFMVTAGLLSRRLKKKN